MSESAPILDPFTQVYTALADRLYNDEVQALVRPNNFVRLDRSNPDPRKAEVAASDFPEILLAPGGSQSETWADNGLRVEQVYEVRVATSEVRVTRFHFPVKWALLRAAWAILDNLGLPFVSMVRLGGIPETVTNQDENRGMDGWSTLFQITVTMEFSPADLTPTSNP